MLAIAVVAAFSFCLTWMIAAAVARTIGLRVLPAYEDNLDQRQEAMSAYAFGRPAGVMHPAGGAVRHPVPVTWADTRMKLIRALVDHEDADELRAMLVEAGALSIVLSEASLYTPTPRTEVFRGQRRVVEFDARLRVEVIAAEPDVQRVVQTIRGIPGAGPYMQVIDASCFTQAVGTAG